MLRARAAANEIQNFLDYLMKSEIALYANPAVANRGLVSWPSRGDGRFLERRGRPSVRDYRHWLETGAYSAVLSDGALLQISYWFDRDLSGHRLAYVPFPYHADAEALRTWDIQEIVESYDGASAESVVLASAVRFDYDARAAGPDHPATHFTINTEGCRVPCAAPMRLGHFVGFVFGNFYQDYWRLHPFLSRLGKEGWMRSSISDEERAGIHVAWSA